MNVLLDRTESTNRKKDVVKVKIDGNNCYIVPKDAGEPLSKSDCIGELGPVGKDVVKVKIDGNNCYIVPKSAGEPLSKSDCIGELELKGRAYQIVILPQTPAQSAQPSATSYPIEKCPIGGDTVLGNAAARLTSRELQIAHLVAKGLLNKQIADQLDLSVYTISTHLRRIFTKLEVHNRTSLVLRLME